jgi:hypothetical protein
MSSRLAADLPLIQPAARQIEAHCTAVLERGDGLDADEQQEFARARWA